MQCHGLKRIATCVVLVLVGCSPQPASVDATANAVQPQPPLPPGDKQGTAPAAGSGQAGFQGYGALRFGMDEARARQVWDGELVGDAPDEPAGCHYLRPKWIENGRALAFMFEGGKFVRIDVGNNREIAPGGGQVGMTANRIHELYGQRVQVQPHKYVEGGRYLRVAGDEGSAALFEVDDEGMVTRWRVGREPQVDYVEGCG